MEWKGTRITDGITRNLSYFSKLNARADLQDESDSSVEQVVNREEIRSEQECVHKKQCTQ